MYEVKITVEIPGLPEAINALANALGKGQTFAAVAKEDLNKGKIKNVDALSSKPIDNGLKDKNPAMAATAETAKNYTVDDVSRAGAALIDQGKMPQLIDLLKKYGVQAVTQLDVSVYPAFVEDMKALGAQL